MLMQLICGLLFSRGDDSFGPQTFIFRAASANMSQMPNSGCHRWFLSTEYASASPSVVVLVVMQVASVFVWDNCAGSFRSHTVQNHVPYLVAICRVRAQKL